MRTPQAVRCTGWCGSAEPDGHNAEELLARAVQARELDSADSIAQVLHHRIDRRVERGAEALARPEREEFLPRSYTDRTPARDDDVRRYVAQLAEAMDRRAERLGEEAAQSPPSWATERLGQVPEDPTARAEWTVRAASVAGYREQFGHEDPAKAIGEAPGRGEPERRAAGQQAASALGMPRDEQDLAARSEGELRNHVAAYDRETEWMPPNVDDRLRVAHLAQREAEGGAARRQAKQDAMLPGDSRRDAHAQRVQQARALAEVLAQRTARLEEIAEARAAAVASVADVEARARAARAELRRRGLDLAEDRERDQADERRDSERHHDAINVPSPDAQREEHRPDIAPERGRHRALRRWMAVVSRHRSGTTAPMRTGGSNATSSEPAPQWRGSLSVGKRNGMSRSVTMSAIASTNVTASTLVMSGDAVSGEEEDGVRWVPVRRSTSVHDEGGRTEGESGC
jgi:hypothetical protein